MRFDGAAFALDVALIRSRRRIVALIRFKYLSSYLVLVFRFCKRV